ncbi:MAG: methyltransferase domain-containing protein [Phycisphaerales bacterium]|nr:MAG: methyltransferase domain-containing protein [Phycisphaerales bacterium]
MSGESQYIHGSEQSEQNRLELQAELLGGTDFLPVRRSGMRILEVGCGTGAIARRVAAEVDPGEVVGVDREETQLETARRLAAAGRIENIRFVHGQAESLPFAAASFDAAYARFLLEHVPDPLRVVVEMTRVVKPGGWVCAFEWEEDCNAMYPESPAIIRVWRGIHELQRLRGGDPFVARKLYAIFCRAGLGAVEAQGRAWTLTARQKDKLALFLDGAREIIRQTREGLLAEGFTDEEMLQRAEKEYQHLLQSPETFILAGFCCAVGIRGSAQ